MRALPCFVALLISAGVSPAPIGLAGTTTAGEKPVADGIVWLDAPGTPAPAHRSPPVLDQIDLQFEPHVLAVQVGTRVKFPNDDRVFHNVFSTHDGKPFDLGLYPVGTVKEIPFDQPGLNRIFCSIHPQMAAYIMVVDTPYFAVSDAAGRFTIAGVPAGRYRYHAWRPGGAYLADVVDVAPGTALSVRWP